jgi:uncharacterized phiE125 gp8 family phage protein
MSLQLLIPPTEEPLSLDELKAHLRVLSDDEDAAVLQYGEAARRAVEARGGLALVAQGWRLVLDRLPNGVLTLPRAPVFSIDAVTLIDKTGAASVIPPEHYDYETGAMGRIVARGLWPQSARLIGGVRIDFTAGWADASEVPSELKLAVKMLAAHFFENREGAAAERVFAVPQAVDALIAPYRQARL